MLNGERWTMNEANDDNNLYSERENVELSYASEAHMRNAIIYYL